MSELLLLFRGVPVFHVEHLRETPERLIPLRYPFLR
jgi:hypothetical protein